MMLEQSLISPNFLGKESFRWFIGVCTQYKEVDDAHGGGYKAKVRIIGYHPSKSVIDDKELPWAHVLVPLNMGAGAGGNGVSFNSDGGEYVIGFFMDGDGGQQPVIIGALFSGVQENLNTFFKGTNNYNSFSRKTAPLHGYNRYASTGRTANSGIPKPDGSIVKKDGGTVYKEQPAAQVTTDIGPGNQVIVNIPPECKNSNSLFSKIVTKLKKFLLTIQQAQRIVNSTLNAISNIPALVQELAQALTDLIYEYIKKIRDLIIGKIYSLLSKFIERLLPKDIKLFKQLITDEVVDEIRCAFYKILQKLSEFFTQFLFQIADKAISIPLCAAEAMIGSVLSTISSQIEESIGPALEKFASQVGGVIGPISQYVSQALSFVDQAVNFFTCESKVCTPQYDYSMNEGFISPKFIENYEGIINYPSQGIQEGKEAAAKWLGITGAGGSDVPPELASAFGGCDITSLNCGLPSVTFFGGGGAGAAGRAVVDSLSQVIGIDIINPGSGYSSAPYVSIEDPCLKGKGAQARAVIDSNGRVSNVIIDDSGLGYENPGGDPCTTNPVDSSGTEVTGYVSSVNIVRSGVGYTTGDVIKDTACPTDIEMYPIVDSNGSIIDVTIVNPGTSVRVLPELEINTASGEGAILQAVLKFNPVKPATVETDINKIQKVILCAEDHGI